MSVLNRICAARGVRYVITRFGNESMRRAAFDELYRNGSWASLDHEISPDLLDSVKRHAGGGRILDLGCGTGLLAEKLGGDAYAEYIGVDVSREALARANQKSLVHSQFIEGDVEGFNPEGEFDLIVFQESLYYVNPMSRLQVLQKYSTSLSPEGRFLVTVVQSDRFASMISLIRERFNVLEDRTLEGSANWRMLVFR